MLARAETRLVLQIGAIAVYLLVLYLAGDTLQETISIFDYGRF
jgi:hypothetical protein